MRQPRSASVQGRSLTGTGLAPNISFYIGSRPIAERNPEVLKVVLAASDEIDSWIRIIASSTHGSLLRKSVYPPR